MGPIFIYWFNGVCCRICGHFRVTFVFRRSFFLTDFSGVTGAPLGGGGASPLRVATGGDANWSSAVRRRRSPAPAQRRREHAGRVRKK